MHSQGIFNYLKEKYPRVKRESERAYVKRLKKIPEVPRDFIKELEADLPELESEVQAKIWEWAESLDMFPIKFESQGTFDSRTGMRRKIIGGTKRKGVSDLFITVGGKLRVCEVKTPEEYGYIMRNWDKIRNHVPKPVPPKIKGVKRKPVNDSKQRYKEQMEFIEKMKELGHGGFFADSIQRVATELMKEPHLLSPLQLRECSRHAALSV